MRARTHSILALATLLLLSISASQGAEPAHHQEKAASPKLGLGTSVTFDGAHRLWRVSANESYVLVSHSTDQGRTFTEPVRVNPEPERIAADGENRPKIAVLQNGPIYVTYTTHLSQPHTGHVRLARSLDGGSTFTAPLTVNDNRDPISHRFDSLVVDRQGRAHVVWIDKRDQAAAGKGYAGAALYYAISEDGTSVGANKKLIDNSCECCRVAMAIDDDGKPVIAWRQIFGQNSRDHAFMRLDGRSKLVRVAEDDWKIDACPHHGPTVASTAGVSHVAWFSASDKRQGLFYARSTDGKSFGNPLSVGNSDSRASHPSLLALKSRVFLAWREFDGTRHAIRVMRSVDSGARWSQPQTLATSTGGSDYPQLLNDGDSVFLSWNTQDGYRLIPVAYNGMAHKDSALRNKY